MKNGSMGEVLFFSTPTRRLWGCFTSDADASSVTPEILIIGNLLHVARTKERLCALTTPFEPHSIFSSVLLFEVIVVPGRHLPDELGSYRASHARILSAARLVRSHADLR